MKFHEIFKIYQPKILAALAAVIFIASGLILYEFKIAGENELSGINSEADGNKNDKNKNLENQNTSDGNNDIDKNINEKNDKNNKSEENIDYKKYQYESEIDGRDELLNLYITGAVRKPGVYKLPKNSRLFNLVHMAGGFNNLADKEAINLVEILHDGTHIHIPTKSETKKQDRDENKKNLNMIIMHDTGKNNFNSGIEHKNFNSSSNSKSKYKNKSKNNYYERVNINTADAAELEKLRGIGPALAKRIIDYRDKNGAFKSVEDLKRVRGIGDAKLKGLQDQAVIN